MKTSTNSFSCKLVLLALSLIITGCRARVVTVPPTPATTGKAVTVIGQRAYTLQERFTLTNEGPAAAEKQNLWVALIRDFPPYQQVDSMRVSPQKYSKIMDEYGNPYAEFDFSGQKAGITQTVTIDYQVTVNELAYDLNNCLGSLPKEFTAPELWIESLNPQIVALSRKLSQDKSTACQQVQAFYNYIGDTLIYTFNGRNWGAQAALGPKTGSDCTEYSDLLVALSRAQGIPARYFEGLLFLDTSTSGIAQQEHAWADVYLPGAGWVAMDPTLGRLPVNRVTYFAHYTPDHIIVTLGTSPSVLRGSNYWTYLYWPGNVTTIKANASWKIDLVK
jgi:transglutaminase-like putative cysteine protease